LFAIWVIVIWGASYFNKNVTRARSDFRAARRNLAHHRACDIAFSVHGRRPARLPERVPAPQRGLASIGPVAMRFRAAVGYSARSF
jgi:hypothetical protein